MPRIPVGKILLGAFAVPWLGRVAFARALSLPLALLVTLSLGLHFGHSLLPESARLAGFVAYWAIFVLFAVTCHRLVLLDPQRIARSLLPTVGWRELRFVLWALAIWAITFGLGMLLLTVAVNALSALGAKGAAEAVMKNTMHILWALGVFIAARLAPLLPATAVDRRVDLRWAWNLTRSNGLRMMIIVGGIPWLTAELAALLYRSDPTVLETVAVTILATALFTVEIAALSLAYRELTKDETPTSPPPPASTQTA